jgi:Tfp pilus assembly protein PilF
MQVLVATVSLLHLQHAALADEDQQKLDAKIKAKINEGTRLYKQGLYEDAAKIFAKLSADYPDILVIERNLGACFYYLHRPEPALSNLRHYLSHKKPIEPDDKAMVERWIDEMEELRAQDAMPNAPALGPGVAATSASKAVATRLLDSAQSLLAKGELAPACAKYAESERLDPQLGTLLHLADCYERIGKTASAWASFKDAVVIASQRHDLRKGAAQAEVEKLEPHLCRLTIEVGADAPPDLEVSSNGSSIGSALLGSPMPMDPGDYLLMAKADGYENWSKRVVVTPGTPNTLVTVPALVRKRASGAVSSQQSMHAPPTMPPPIPTAQQQLPPSSELSDPGLRRRTIGYALGAVGVVGIGVGIGFGLAKEAKQSDRDSANACSKTSSCTDLDKSKIDQLTSEAKTRATVANVGFVAGGVALAAGAILVVTGWPKSRPSASAQVQPWIGDRSAGFVVGGVW